MRAPTRSIVIVGGGFCGTVLAVNLLRRPPNQPTRITLVEQRPQIGRGVAYRDGPSECLLNVPAARMSADSRDPTQFVRFAQRRMGHVAAGDFLPRRLYGEYLQELLSDAERAAPGHVHLERLHAQARAIRPFEHPDSYLVDLAGRPPLRADTVVLACGDPPPVCPAFAAGVVGHPNYVGDPYRDGALQARTRTMVVIGTGLTAADTIVTAAALSPGITIHAISRHGLLPAEQRSGAGNAAEPDLPWAGNLATISARGIFAHFRTLSRQAALRGGDWREVITRARNNAAHLWEQLSLVERKRFLRHARTYWDVHRHRLPPAVAARLSALRDANQLHVHAGHILKIASEGARLQVRWRPRGTDHVAVHSADCAVNCTGADRRLERSNEPLLADLLGTGLAMADPLGIGLQTDRQGQLVDRDGRAREQLYYLGPMLRAQHWEATAVGELRVHAEQLAQCLARDAQDALAARAFV